MHPTPITMTLPKDVDICVKLLPASPSAAYKKGTALRQPRALARARNVVPAENFGRSRIPGPGFCKAQHASGVPQPFRSISRPTSVFHKARSGHEKVMSRLERSLKLRNFIIKRFQTRGIKEVVAENVHTEESSLLDDLLHEINAKPKLWTFSLCLKVAPNLKKIFSERDEAHADAGLEALQASLHSLKPKTRCLKLAEALHGIRMNQPFLERRLSMERRQSSTR